MAKRNLVPIRIRFNKKPNGQANYPVTEQNLPDDVRKDADGNVIGGMDYLATCGLGNFYDKMSHLGGGHDHGTLCTAVPAVFAEAAAAQYPRSANPCYCVEIIDEAELQSFIDERAHAHLPTVNRNDKALTSLKAERDLRIAIGKDTIAIDLEIVKALDPDDVTPGVSSNDQSFSAIKTRQVATFDSSKADFIAHPIA